MLKLCANRIIFFDAEWVPDAATGRRLYDLLPSGGFMGTSDDEVIERMWQEAGADASNPRPYLKTVLCRIVSFAAVYRRCDEGGTVKLSLHSAPGPDEGELAEKDLLTRVFAGLRVRPQLVGFNSVDADLPALLQRGVACGLYEPLFCTRPDKPWQGVDYFVRHSDWHVDLKSCFGGFGKATPSQAELAAACGVPGKLGVSGVDVVDLLRRGEIWTVVQYNQWDALTVYLIWLRVAQFCGFLTPEQRAEEERMLALLLLQRSRESASYSTYSHLKVYLDAWQAMGGPVVELPAVEEVVSA